MGSAECGVQSAECRAPCDKTNRWLALHSTEIGFWKARPKVLPLPMSLSSHPPPLLNDRVFSPPPHPACRVPTLSPWHALLLPTP